MYSLLYLRRRADNTRGSPVRAALLWSMLEEARIYTEDHFNMNQRVVTRPIRDLIAAITGEIRGTQIILKPDGFSEKFDLIDPDFQVRAVESLLPTNPLWKQQVGQFTHAGLLVEVQTIGCRTDMVHLAKNWWPLTSATVSRSLNVSLNIFFGTFLVFV